jgi:hypothetical protein
MKKLKLDLGELEVQSFPTAESPAGREGTVYGMKVSTDQVPHCPQEPGGVYYNVGLDASFGCLNGLAFDSGEIACGDNGAAGQGFQVDVA